MNLQKPKKSLKLLVLGFVIIVIGAVVATSFSLTTRALPATFDPNEILTNDDFKNLPGNFSSPDQIQNLLIKNRSLLANIEVDVSLEPDDTLYNTPFTGRPDYLVVNKVLAPFVGTKMKPADLIWRLAQTDMGNGCSTTYAVCINNRTQGLNPVFILGMIQRESGLVYGTNAQLDPNSDYAKFLLDRVLGYYCKEVSDRSKSCFDENPDWKYFKGFFRQLYYGMRNFRIFEQVCANPSIPYLPSHSPYYRVNNTIQLSDGTVTLRNGITCALYRYTPHIYNGQYNLWNSMRTMLAADTSVYYRPYVKTRFPSIVGMTRKSSGYNSSSQRDVNAPAQPLKEDTPDPTRGERASGEQLKNI
ncbi:MAG: hypothetical protein OHK0017_09640 [Patescibacteria group bacterium]